MSLFNSGHSSSADCTNNAPGATTIAQDGELEKGPEAWRSEDGAIEPVVAHIDPEIERRVVRKLDRHVVSLVMALCKSHFLFRSHCNI
jgi:hypothetical protein